MQQDVTPLQKYAQSMNLYHHARGFSANKAKRHTRAVRGHELQRRCITFPRSATPPPPAGRSPARPPADTHVHAASLHPRNDPTSMHSVWQLTLRLVENPHLPTARVASASPPRLAARRTPALRRGIGHFDLNDYSGS
ncbi:hypothetical protein HYPSUDRAFT_198780 [Hypholoma sublateritium FD-334 SS-4]|uniref:Uncharacterized protein n=1 Tax=Hypholoma sublateritium (strain FD-334 SS-4) TaxID=945553 RepID=A0A0D2P6B9_HYPSF|nr:hypothetical protein HYPSUDRAFT_198780 [Hypholoma sublateritium FD-334 SS-4]